MSQATEDAYFQGKQDMESKLLPKIEELRHRLEMANDGWARGEDENRKLRYVMETAQTMRDDYEAYSFTSDSGTYATEQHDPEILKDFDDAVKAVSGE